MPGKLLGIDHGLKRIGLAVSDTSRLVARELAIIRRESRQKDFEQINRLASDEQVAGIIVGLPEDEHPGKQATIVRKWAERLAETTSLPIILWDEQLSSVDAQNLARQKRRKPDEPIDDLAARVILQSYLDAVRDGLAPELPRE